MVICLRAVLVVLTAILLLPISLNCLCLRDDEANKAEVTAIVNREPGREAPPLRTANRLDNISIHIDEIKSDGRITYTITNNTDLEIIISSQFFQKLEYFDGEIWRVVPNNSPFAEAADLTGPIVMPGHSWTLTRYFGWVHLLTNSGGLYRIRESVFETASTWWVPQDTFEWRDVVIEFYWP